VNQKSAYKKQMKLALEEEQHRSDETAGGGGEATDPQTLDD